MKKGKKTILTIFLIPVSCILVIFLIEVVLAVIDFKPPLSQGWYLTTQNRVLDDNIIMIRPEFLQENLYKRHENTIQIVALGDSFTEGFTADPGNDYPAVLKNLLKSKNINCDVINAGIGNTGTDQQLSLFKNIILKRTTPDIVIWQFYVNDIWDNVMYPVYSFTAENLLVPRSGKLNWIYKRQVFYNALPFPAGVKQGSRIINLILKSFEASAQNEIPKEFRKNPYTWGWNKYALEIDDMKNLSQEKGFDLYFFLITPQAFYLAASGDNSENWESSAYVAEYERMYQKASVQYHFIPTQFSNDDFSILRKEFPGQPFNAPIEISLFSMGRNDPNRPGDKHHNNFGYWMLAQKVGNYIIQSRNMK